jgi:hypothetical protein
VVKRIEACILLEPREGSVQFSGFASKIFDSGSIDKESLLRVPFLTGYKCCSPC